MLSLFYISYLSVDRSFDLIISLSYLLPLLLSLLSPFPTFLTFFPPSPSPSLILCGKYDLGRRGSERKSPSTGSQGAMHAKPPSRGAPLPQTSSANEYADGPLYTHLSSTRHSAHEHFQIKSSPDRFIVHLLTY